MKKRLSCHKEKSGRAIKGGNIEEQTTVRQLLNCGYAVGFSSELLKNNRLTFSKLPHLWPGKESKMVRPSTLPISKTGLKAAEGLYLKKKLLGLTAIILGDAIREKCTVDKVIELHLDLTTTKSRGPLSFKPAVISHRI